MTAGGLLAGPDPRLGMEPAVDHEARLGPLPRGDTALVDTLERSGLRGRGGAAFPVATKWHAVASRARGRAVVLANGAEGEPLSRKDRVLMESRPHLVLDGAALAAAAVGARDVVLYVGAEHGRAGDALQRALAERPAAERRRTRVLLAPPRYVAGEESAAVEFVNHGVALPTTTPPRPFERGVGGRPTLVHNVETLAHVALIARRGDGWFRSVGSAPQTPGSVLISISGAGAAARVVEVAQGTALGAALAGTGTQFQASGAVLLGGYFGGWVDAPRAWSLPLDSAALRDSGHALGCGVVALLPARCCGLVETARIAGYLAEQSARQCGPCVFGLRAIADALARVAGCSATADDLERLKRWSGELPGRGACRHPDGAARLVASALDVFADDLTWHLGRRRCAAAFSRAA